MRIIEKVQHHALSRPNALALSQKVDGQWLHLDWATVWQKVAHMGSLLQRDGVSKGDRVAIFADNSIEWTLIDLACIYAGAVSIPLYATSSPKQIHYILQHSEASVVFAGASQNTNLLPVLGRLEHVKKVILLDQPQPDSPITVSFDQWISESTEITPIVATNDDDLLTIVYTSGTTGDPKGVMLAHGNQQAAIESHLADIAFTENDRSLAALPLSHIFERGWTYIVLFAGGHNHYLIDIQDLANQLQEVKPHVFCAVPRIFEKIHAGIFHKAKKAGALNYAIVTWANNRVLRNQHRVQEGKTLGWYQNAMQALARKLVGAKIKAALGGEVRFMPCGGASLDADIHSFFMAMGINVKLGYGMTETLGTVSFLPDNNYELGTVGEPMAGIEIKIDPAEGEIFVKSPSMTPGYYKNETATDELFSDGWLKTGDAGSINSNGNLVFRERLKELMKTSGGKYIAPQYVEGVLIREQLFEQVAVIADTRKFVSALIVPAWEALEEYAQSINIHYEDKLELLRHAKITKYVEQKLLEVQGELAGFEKVKCFTLLPREFSIEQGEITPTLKLRRKVILQRFAAEIEAMYKQA